MNILQEGVWPTCQESPNNSNDMTKDTQYHAIIADKIYDLLEFLPSNASGQFEPEVFNILKSSLKAFLCHLDDIYSENDDKELDDDPKSSNLLVPPVPRLKLNSSTSHSQLEGETTRNKPKRTLNINECSDSRPIGTGPAPLNKASNASRRELEKLHSVIAYYDCYKILVKNSGQLVEFLPSTDSRYPLVVAAQLEEIVIRMESHRPLFSGVLKDHGWLLDCLTSLIEHANGLLQRANGVEVDSKTKKSPTTPTITTLPHAEDQWNITPNSLISDHSLAPLPNSSLENNITPAFKTKDVSNPSMPFNGTNKESMHIEGTNSGASNTKLRRSERKLKRSKINSDAASPSNVVIITEDEVGNANDVNAETPIRETAVGSEGEPLDDLRSDTEKDTLSGKQSHQRKESDTDNAAINTAVNARRKSIRIMTRAQTSAAERAESNISNISTTQNNLKPQKSLSSIEEKGNSASSQNNHIIRKESSIEPTSLETDVMDKCSEAPLNNGCSNKISESDDNQNTMEVPQNMRNSTRKKISPTDCDLEDELEQEIERESTKVALLSSLASEIEQKPPINDLTISPEINYDEGANVSLTGKDAQVDIDDRYDIWNDAQERENFYATDEELDTIKKPLNKAVKQTGGRVNTKRLKPNELDKLLSDIEVVRPTIGRDITNFEKARVTKLRNSDKTFPKDAKIPGSEKRKPRVTSEHQIREPANITSTQTKDRQNHLLYHSSHLDAKFVKTEKSLSATSLLKEGNSLFSENFFLPKSILDVNVVKFNGEKGKVSNPRKKQKLSETAVSHDSDIWLNNKPDASASEEPVITKLVRRKKPYHRKSSSIVGKTKQKTIPEMLEKQNELNNSEQH